MALVRHPSCANHVRADTAGNDKQSLNTTAIKPGDVQCQKLTKTMPARQAATAVVSNQLRRSSTIAIDPWRDLAGRPGHLYARIERQHWPKKQPTRHHPPAIRLRRQCLLPTATPPLTQRRLAQHKTTWDRSRAMMNSIGGPAVWAVLAALPALHCTMIYQKEQWRCWPSTSRRLPQIRQDHDRGKPCL